MRRLLIGLLLAAPRGALGLGLSTKFAQVTVDNLKIGQTYSLTDLVNLPLRVANTDKDPVDVSMRVLQPPHDAVIPGYEPIPDPAWISLQKSSFKIPPGMEAVTDVVITLPDDPKLLGRRFQAFIWTRSDNIGSLGVGLNSRLLISVSSARPSDEEAKRKFAPKRLANLNFSLSPMEVALPGVPAGERFELKGKDATVKLLNPNEEAYTFRFTPVSVWETSITPVKGFEAAPDPKWLEVKEPLLKAAPDSITRLELALNIPKGHAGKRYLFILRAEILEQDIPAYAYVQLYVETAK